MARGGQAGGGRSRPAHGARRPGQGAAATAPLRRQAPVPGHPGRGVARAELRAAARRCRARPAHPQGRATSRSSPSPTTTSSTAWVPTRRTSHSSTTTYRPAARSPCTRDGTSLTTRARAAAPRSNRERRPSRSSGPSSGRSPRRRGPAGAAAPPSTRRSAPRRPGWPRSSGGSRTRPRPTTTTTRRRMLVEEWEVLEAQARDFGPRGYDLDQPGDRRAFRARLLSFIRPEALEVIERHRAAVPRAVRPAARLYVAHPQRALPAPARRDQRQRHEDRGASAHHGPRVRHLLPLHDRGRAALDHGPDRAHGGRGAAGGAAREPRPLPPVRVRAGPASGRAPHRRGAGRRAAGAPGPGPQRSGPQGAQRGQGPGDGAAGCGTKARRPRSEEDRRPQARARQRAGGAAPRPAPVTVPCARPRP